MKTLVVYFSRDGHTKKIAEQIAEKLNADIEAIKESTNRKGIIGWLKSGAESARGKVPEINTLSNDVESYDLVVVGTPVWAGTVASPVRGFLSQYRESIKEAAFFCTMGSSEGRTFDEMKELSGKEPKAVSSYTAKAINTGEYLSSLEKYLETLG